MKKILSILIILAMATAMLAGCADPASASVSAEMTPTPTPFGTPVPTTAPDVVPATPTPDDGISGAVSLNGWLYYLNEADAITAEYGEDPPLCRKNEETESVEDMGLRGFQFDIIGSYLYLDSNYPDLDENGNQTWFTTRMSLDGTGQRRLEYRSMSERLIPEGANQFYFTVAGDSAVYISDFSCESITVLMITLPDSSDLNRKLGSKKELQLDISGVEGGWITFAVTYITPEGIQMYKGTYKISTNGATVEKISGTYYDYQTIQNALD